MAEKKTKTKKVTEKVAVSTIVKKARITEKAALLNEKNVYTFEVFGTATKNEIKKEIEKMYKVKPLRVNIIQIKAKNVFVRGKKGVKKGGKKAIVYLKKGDKIALA